MSSASRVGRLRLDISHLWPIIILAAFGFLVSLNPLPPNDFWWHLRIGEIISRTHEIPSTNQFAWTLPSDSTFVYAAWLGELALYAIYRWGGLALVTFVRTLIVLMAFWLVAVEAHRRSNSWRIAAFALGLACLMSLNNLVIRPQLWSFLPFVIFFTLLSRYVDGDLRRGWLLVCPGIMVLWVNAHGAFVLGLVLCGGVAVGELFQLLTGGASADRRRRTLWLGFITLLVALATLVNPRGLEIATYVRDLLTDAPSQSLVVEWQSPTPTGIANVAFYVSILVILLVFASSRVRLRATNVLLLLGFLWLAWQGQRYVVWFAMVAMPILAEAIAGLDLSFLQARDLRRNWLNTALGCLLFLPVVLVQPWWVERMPLPDIYWSQVHRGTDIGPLTDVETPIGAAEFLAAHPGGRLFNEMGYGSYLIWAVPEQGVFIDPRVELYPYDQWMDYVRIGRGVRYNELLESYGADRILLSLAQQPELALALADDPLWTLEYEDAYAQLWTRSG